MSFNFGRHTTALAAVLATAVVGCSSAAPAAPPAATAAPAAAAKPTTPPPRPRSPPATTASTGSTSGAPVELVFVPHVTPNLTVDFWNKEIANFQAANPDIKVTISAGPDTKPASTSRRWSRRTARPTSRP